MATSPTTLTMAEQLVPDDVWTAIQPLPAKRPHPKGGRPWVEDQAVGNNSLIWPDVGLCCSPRGGPTR